MITLCRMDPTGDTRVECETEQVAQEALTAFLDECVRTHGNSAPPVWIKRTTDAPGAPADILENPRDANLDNAIEVFIQPGPLVGG